MGDWNMASLWEVIADQIPQAPALVHGSRRRTWAEFERNADALARTLVSRGARRQDTVGQYLYNGIEYVESLFGVFKASLVPVNTNYRYVEDELIYLWDNADAVAVIFQGSFTHRVDAVRERLPRVRTWIWVDDGTGECPEWAISYSEATTRGPDVHVPWGRSGDDLYLMYTGGTTGLPKGVMWRVDDIVALLNATSLGVSYPEDGNLDDVRAMVFAPGPVGMPASPLMHGTGAFTAFSILNCGGSLVLLPSPSFDPIVFLDLIERERVNLVGMVGDAFGKPMVHALDAEPGRWDLSSLVGIVSSGTMWSDETKRSLLRHEPALQLTDALTASEAPGMGVSISSSEGTAKTATFLLGDNARVVDDRGRDVIPGSGTIGRVAVTGRIPIGYYKEPERTAATFVEIEGRLHSIPGDYATVDADGSVHLLGRGSLCINSAGEKVYPTEVEEALKTHESVLDAVVVGVPDDRFGEVVVALVEAAGLDEPGEDALIAHVRRQLAPYKAPKRVFTVESLARAANGKADYPALRAHATAELGKTSRQPVRTC
jgi:acyl-CoA synthetase (AMP-forming)/AMP-acid ligase II